MSQVKQLQALEKSSNAIAQGLVSPQVESCVQGWAPVVKKD